MLHKLKSIKNILLIWIIMMISIIVFTNNTDFLPLVQNLALCVLAYFPINVAQDYIYNNKLNK